MGSVVSGVGNAIGGLFGGGGGITSGYSANGANLDQTSYQQALQNALTQMNGAVPQQQQLAQMLMQQSQGIGPGSDLAKAQLQQATERNQQQAAGLMGSQRGGNIATAQRSILNTQANTGQQMANQYAQLQAQQRLGAMGQLGTALTNQRAQDIGQVSQLGSLQNAQNQTRVQNALGAQGINAGISAQNTQNQAGLIGGLLGGAGTIGAAALLASKGGHVPGEAKVFGDSEHNDTVPAMLSPGEIVIPRSKASDPEKAKEFIDNIMNKKQSKSLKVKKDGKEFQIATKGLSPEMIEHIKGYYEGTDEEGVQPESAMPDANETPTPTSPFIAPAETAAPMSNTMTQSTPVPGESPVPMAAETPAPGSLPTAQDAQTQDTSAVPADQQIAAPKPAQLTDLTSAQSQMEEMFGHQEKAIEAEQQAKQIESKGAVNAYSGLANDLDTLRKTSDTQLKAINDQSDSLYQSMASKKIDPNHYWANMSTGNKIGAAIGLALGGMGAGLTHGPNMALDIINKSIDRDMDAQKSNMNQQGNLLRLNLQRTNNIYQAELLTRSQLTAAAQAKVGLAQAQALDPQSQAQLETMKASLAQNRLNYNIQLSRMKALQGLSGGQAGANNTGQIINQIGLTDPKQAEELRNRYVPGVGMAEIKVPDKIRDEMLGRQALDESLTNLSNFAKQHQGSLDPATINQGKALAATAQDAYRRANAQGVFREAEKNFVEGVVDKDPTKFFSEFRTLPKYQAAIDSNKVQLNAVKRSYGLPIQFQPKTATPHGAR